MKFVKLVLIVFSVAAVIAISSCKKSSTSPNTAVEISFKVNDTAKNADLIVTDLDKSTNTLQVSGTVGLTGAISLSIKNPKVGTFDVATDGLALIYSTQADVKDTFTAISGTVVITSLTNSLVTGTFQFNAVSGQETTAAITNGVFRANLVSQ